MSAPATVVTVALHHIAALRDRLEKISQENDSGSPVVLAMIVLGTKSRMGVVESFGVSSLSQRLGFGSTGSGFSWDHVREMFPMHAGPLQEFARDAPRNSHVALLVTVQTGDAIHCTVVGIPMRKTPSRERPNNVRPA
jgi:hypothetical protein